MSAIALDPLIAEAKECARRRRLLALGALVVVAAAAVGTTLGLRSPSRTALGMCATAPSGWKEKTVTIGRRGPPTVVLTNWRFGRMQGGYGLWERLPWPAHGITVAVSNEGPVGTHRLRGTLRVAAGDFNGFEGMTSRGAHGAQIQVQAHGRFLNARVEVGTLTPATIAAANQALAGVQVCSA